jgi:hypothetical protein
VTDYTWPADIIPSSSEWRYIANTAAFISPITGATRTIYRGGDRWGCTLTLSNLTGAKRATLTAFIARLRGQLHRVVLPNHAFQRRGTQSANVSVKGANQSGESVLVDGGTNGATLLAGDMVSVGSNLHMIVADATFNGSGEATLSIVPPLRVSPADNAVVAVTGTGRFMLTENTFGWSNVPGGFSSMTLDFVEDIVP